jgi:D-arabinose 1-dehydrogenase-like Zn-dependent alcohol dehydrogenase
LLRGNQTRKKIWILLELVESDKIKPVIDRCYPLDEINDAFRYFEEGNPQGKVVITILHNNKK